MAYHLKHKPEKWISQARVLCIDHGTKTLGLAICNDDQTVVTPMETIHRKKWKDDSGALGVIIAENDVKAVVVGYPLNMDGSAGGRCQSVRDYVALMEEHWPELTFLFWDERLSTQNVDKLLDKQRDKTREKRKVFKDALAAAMILEEALLWVKNNA
jgi:putative Holliday junction resolvase